MSKTVKVHGMMAMLAGMQVKPNTADFPVNPGLGQVHSSGNSVYIFTEVAGFQTWYPLVRGSDSATYLHTQASSRTVWNVTHDLGTSDVWFIIKNTDGDYQDPYSVEPDPTDPLNKLIVTFIEPEAGTMFIVGCKAFSSARVNTSQLTIGGSVDITSSGITINGVTIDLPTIAAAGLVSTQLATEVTRALNAESALQLALAAEANRATVAEAGLRDSINSLVSAVAAATNSTAALDAATAAINAEATRAKGAEGNLNDLATSVKTSLTLAINEVINDVLAETTRAKAAEVALGQRIDVASAGGDTVNTLLNVSGSVSLDYSKGSYVVLTVAGITSLAAVSNVPDNTHAFGMTLEIKNGGSNVNFPANINWVNGTPNLRVIGTTMITLTTRDGGVSWIGMSSS